MEGDRKTNEHYVIGFVENGERALSCRGREYDIEEGSIVLFNPDDSHACVQSDEGTFDYRGFNISKEIMLDLAEKVTGKRKLPGFQKMLSMMKRHPAHGSCHNGGGFRVNIERVGNVGFRYGDSFGSCGTFPF